MEKTTISIKLDPKLWKEVQHRSIDDNLQYSEFVERALKEALQKKS